MLGADLGRRAVALASIGASILALACSPLGQEGGSAATPFKPVGSVEDIMHDVVYPHADVLWDSVGTIIDSEGMHEIRPASEEEWERVMQSALTVAEAGNLLMMEGRAKDADAWMQHASALIDAATLAMDAAMRRDAEAVFDTGGQVYTACNDCHERYWEKPPSAMRP